MTKTDADLKKLKRGVIELVSEEDLRLFLEVHGSDVTYMRDLWADIEARILSLLSPDADSTIPADSIDAAGP